MLGDIGLLGLLAGVVRFARVAQLANPVLQNVLLQLWDPMFDAFGEHGDPLGVWKLHKAKEVKMEKLGENGVKRGKSDLLQTLLLACD